MKAVAIGAVTQGLLALGLGSPVNTAGFVTSTRNGKGLLFHITSVERVEPAQTGSGSN